MIALIGLLLLGAVLYAAFTALWPLPILAAIVWIAFSPIKMLTRRADDRRETHAALAARADEQHRQIMDGDTIAGTYGRYLPPEELQ